MTQAEIDIKLSRSKDITRLCGDGTQPAPENHKELIEEIIQISKDIIEDTKRGR